MPTVALGAKFVQSRAGGQPATSTRGAWVVYPGYPWGLPDVGLGRLFAVRCAVQVHLSHNVPGVHFVRAVRVMRTAVLGPGTANDIGEMKPPNMIKQTAAATTSDHALHSC